MYDHFSEIWRILKCQGSLCSFYVRVAGSITVIISIKQGHALVIFKDFRRRSVLVKIFFSDVFFQEA